MKYFIWLASPIGVWLSGWLFAVLFLRARPRLKLGVTLASNLFLLVFALPIVGDFLLGSLEQQAQTMEQARPLPPVVDVIVVLGGATQSAFEGVRSSPDLNDSADRLWRGAQLYQQGVSNQILVSGGRFTDDPRVGPEADSMATVLQALGVPDVNILRESESRTTLENAHYTRQILQSQGREGSVALVTSAFHMRRAVALFERAGLNVFPVRADIRVVPEDKPFWRQLPRVEALEYSTLALKERLGWWQIVLRGLFEPGDSS